MDPRITRTHTAVMEAATELLVEGGPEAMTIDAVVARSGVAKSTLYRHWSTREELVDDVFTSCAPDLSPPDPSLGFEDALRRLIRDLVVMMGDDHWKRLIPALLSLRLQHRGVADLDSELKERQHEVFADVLRQGVSSGELDASSLDDTDRTITLAMGPILMAALLDTVVMDESFADAVVDQFLSAHRPPT